MTRAERVRTLGLFVVVFLLLLTWTIATPLFASPDEPAHLYKAYGTAHGQATGERMTEQLSNIRRFDVPPEMGVPLNITCFVFNPVNSAGCVQVEPSDAGVSTAAVYPPFWYALVGGGARVTGQDTSQRAYRAVAALLCAALIAAAVAVAKRSAAHRFLPLLLLGLTPMTLFLAGTVNPNGFEVAGFVFLWTLCLHTTSSTAASARGGMIVGSTVAVLLLSRFASAIWVAIGAVALAVLLGTTGLKRFLNRSFLVPALGISGAAVVALLAWSRYAGAESEDPRLATDASFGDVIRTSWERTPGYLRELIGVLGWLDTELPAVVYVMFAVFSALAVVGVVLSRDARLGLVTAAVCVGVVLVPIAINALSARSAGLIWQGRYTLPLFAMLSLLGMLGWQRVHERSERRSIPIAVGLVASVCFVVAEIAAFWQALRRFTVGAGGKIWLDEPLPWSPSIAPMTLIALNAVLVVAVAAVVVTTAWSDRSEPSTAPGPTTHTLTGEGQPQPVAE